MKKQNKKTKKGLITQIIVGITAALCSYYFTQKLFTKKDLLTELKTAALEVNKITPMQIDQFSRLDSASTKGKTNFIYHYTLIDIDKSEVNIDTVNKYIRTDIIDNVKNSSELETFKDNNVTIDYRYYDKNGEFTLEISVTPEIYKNK